MIARRILPSFSYLNAFLIGLFLILGFFGYVSDAFAASSEHDIDGAGLSLVWAIPFVGILLSIAVIPLINNQFFHDHHGKIAFLWGGMAVAAIWYTFGLNTTLYQLWHIFLLEYLPFLLLVGSLYIITSGIHLSGDFVGTPKQNLTMLTIGTVIASIVGTTGAAMLLIRLVLRSNEGRKSAPLTVVFFIFLVANVGGALSPIGDPPLFLGFLKGVPFFWPLEYLIAPTAFTAVCLLSIHYAIDSFSYRRHKRTNQEQFSRSHSGGVRLKIDGKLNFVWIFGVIVFVLLSGFDWGGSVDLAGVEVTVMGLLRDVALIALCAASLIFGDKNIRLSNHFEWFPITEVAKLFAGIFVSILPVIAILRAGSDGAFSLIYSALIDQQTGEHVPKLYFVITALLSGFLDNAPTYLVFFNAAGGNPVILTTVLSHVLMAISLGAVYGGAMSYIGNAPNFLVRSIAVSRGVAMPSFFAYVAIALVTLVPIMVIQMFIFV